MEQAGRASRSISPADAGAEIDAHAASSENAVVWTLWLTYGAFYFCRTNISSAAPGMQLPVAEGGLGLLGSEVGWILASLKIAYGVGQLVNGQLSERISPRVMLAIGMFGSAALNVLFGLGTGFYFLLFVWAMNGFCQSLGWTPVVRVAANWVPIARRGRAMGIIGTGYQITLGLTYVIASQAAEWLGWQGAMYVPAALLALAGVFMLLFLREEPEENKAPSPRHGESPATCPLPEGEGTQAPHISASEVLYWTLYNPTLWLIGLSLGLLNACRYGFLDWGVVHLMETRNVGVGKAGLQFFVIAIGAAAGSYLAGWASDRFFGGRRAPMVCLLMGLLGALTLVYDAAIQTSVIGSMLLLVVIGFCIIGPQVLMVGTAPADLAHRGTSAAAAGFVNFMGYMGAATGDVATGHFSSAEHGGWQTAIYVWAGWAFAGAAIMAILWNTTSRKVGVLPGYVPKIGAVATLAVAAVATWYGGQPLAAQLAAIAAIIFVVACLVNRVAALPAIAAAMVGLVVVFIAYVRGTDDVTWPETTAMIAYGLAMIMTLMILVERNGAAAICE
jgi:sugar phosphate permease